MTSPKPDATPARVLIVDDEQAQMKALCDTLRDHGYDTMGFCQGEAALTALRAQPFDLLLTDLMMPGMDGISLLRHAVSIDPNLVGIVMTGHGAIDTAVEAMKTGALDYVLKPFKLSAMLPVLSRGLLLRRLRVENVRLENKLRERSKELEAANRELDAFASSVAHQLNAPARHVAGYAQILLRDHSAEMTEKAQRRVKVISSAAQNMGTLITDLLAFARLTRMELSLESVDLNQIVVEVRQQLEPECSGRNIEFKVATLPTVQADPSMIRQVFFNLLSNAVKYTSRREVAKIEIGSSSQAEEVVVFVRDNGAGFDPQYAQRLFGIFQRLHRAEEFEGTGVGLHMVQRIIARHHGRVWAESQVDQGATFYFALPISNGATPA